MAAGLFGDVGSPVLQNMLCFTPHGNTLSGTQDGDVFVWSSGTVTAKIEAAHKAEVRPAAARRRPESSESLRVIRVEGPQGGSAVRCRAPAGQPRGSESLRVYPGCSASRSESLGTPWLRQSDWREGRGAGPGDAARARRRPLHLRPRRHAQGPAPPPGAGGADWTSAPRVPRVARQRSLAQPSRGRKPARRVAALEAKPQATRAGTDTRAGTATWADGQQGRAESARSDLADVGPQATRADTAGTARRCRGRSSQARHRAGAGRGRCSTRAASRAC